MPKPREDVPITPPRRWYLLAAGLWLAAIVIAYITFKPLLDNVGHGVDGGVENGGQVAISAEGVTVYASNIPATMECSATGSDGAAIALEPFGEDNFGIKADDGSSVTAVAITPEDLAAGTYSISCTDLDEDGVLGTGDRIDLDAMSPRFQIGLSAAGAVGISGTVALIVIIVRRHRSKLARMRA